MIRFSALLLVCLAAACGKPDGQATGALGAPVFDPTAFGPRDAPPTGPEVPAEILDWGPRGDAVGTYAVGQVHVRFNRPIVPFGGAQAQSSDELRVLTDRALVPGHAYWQTPDQLVFESEGALAPAHEYTASFSGRDGAEPMKWTFETARPQVNLIEPPDGGSQVAEDAPMFLSTTLSTPHDEIARRLKVTANGGEVPVDVVALTDKELEQFGFGSDDMAYRLDHAPFPVGAKIQVDVAAGWLSKAGPLPANEAHHAAFDIHPPLSVTAVSCTDPAQVCDLQPIDVQFSTAVPASQRSKIHLTPKPADFRVAGGWGEDESTTDFSLEGHFLPGRKYTVTVDAGLTDDFGQRLGARRRFEVEFRMPPADVYLTSTTGSIVDDGTAHLGISSRHVRRLRVSAARVPVAKYRDLYFADRWRADKLPPLAELGDVVSQDIDVSVQEPVTEWGSTPFDLAALVGSFRGPVAVRVEALEGTDSYQVAGLASVGLFEVGSFAPHMFTSTPRSVLRVEDVVRRSPVAGLEVTAWDRATTRTLGTTDADGLLELPGRSARDYAEELVVVRDRESGEVGIVGMATAARERDAAWLEPGEWVDGALVAERGVYRPGDDLYVTGWLAVRTPHNPWGHRPIPEDVRAQLELVDRDDVVLADIEAPVVHGKVWGKLSIPTSARPGSTRVRATLKRNGSAARRRVETSVRVEEFRTPDFEVRATAGKAEVVGSEEVRVAVESNYLSGSPADILHLRASQRCWPSLPPDVDGWVLGVQQHDHYGIGSTRPSFVVDAPGRAHAVLSALGDPDGDTRDCAISVTVQNRSFQEEGGVARVVAHPSERYLGMHRNGDVLTAKDPLDVELAEFDVHGRRVDAAKDVVDVTITRHSYEPVYATRGKTTWVNRWDTVDKVVRRCKVDLARPQRCRVARLEEGEYVVEGRSRTDAARVLRTTLEVQGRADDAPAFVRIAAPTEQLRPGQPVKITVETASPQGILFVERYGIRDIEAFRTRGGKAEIELKSDETWAPQMSLTAFAIDYAPERLSLERAHATLEFDAALRDLEVNVQTAPTATVRERVPVHVRARDATGPVNGRAAIWAVDDAVLALTHYQVPDLARVLLPRPVADLDSIDELSAFLPAFRPQRYDPYRAFLRGFGNGSGFGAGGGGLGGKAAEPRSDFRATPLFLGDVAVVDGAADVEFDLPDNMTRFRVIAVVSADLPGTETPLRFGSGEATITVGAPLVVRPALPRFLRPGDAPELAAIVDNASSKPGRLELEMALKSDAIDWVTGVSPHRDIHVASGEQVRVGFAARAMEPGKGVLTISARLTPDDGSAPIVDAVQMELQSATEPTMVETVAMYGTLDDARGVGIPIKPPRDVRADVGGIELTLTSTILGGLRDATRELIHYPYGCAEQTASRMLPLVALARLRDQVEPSEIPNGATIDEFVDRGIERLLGMQQSDGGFGYWPDSPSSPYVSAYVTWVLTMAKKAGHEVPETRLDHALSYLEGVTDTPDRDLPDSTLYFHDLRRAIAVFVLAEAGRQPVTAINDLFERRRDLPIFAQAFVAAALVRTNADDPRREVVARELTNVVTETPGSASVVEAPRYDLGAYFHSDLRSSAIVMMALMRLQPDHPVITKLARGLMEKRYRGAWRNTQENAYALVALSDYAERFEATEPNFEITAWVDHAVLVEDRWRGRSSKARTGRIPIAEVLSLSGRTPAGTLPLNIRRRGKGRAYYRLAMTYAPTGPDLPPIARGIEIHRTFRIEGTPSVTSVPAKVQAGAVIAIDIEVESKALTRYVAIDIPLPAGFEGIDLSLGSAKTLPMGGVWGWWVTHREYHDDRIILFADTLQPGRHVHTVYVRATTPGTFAFPPTHATAMYTPEVFGRTDGASIDIAD